MIAVHRVLKIAQNTKLSKGVLGYQSSYFQAKTFMVYPLEKNTWVQTLVTTMATSVLVEESEVIVLTTNEYHPISGTVF